MRRSRVASLMLAVLLAACTSSREAAPAPTEITDRTAVAGSDSVSIPASSAAPSSASSTSAVPQTTGIAGSSGVGDPLLPQAGNGGYDVLHYDLDMAWSPDTDVLDATATISAMATADLRSFNLDLRGFDVGAVSVNGTAATFTRQGQELTIAPAASLAAGSSLEIVVAYAGVPATIVDGDGSVEGWIRTADGVTALGEPQGSPGWFPVNDHPSDKATFTLSMTVPTGLTVASNGQPAPPVTDGVTTTFTWTEKHLMAPYLATVAIDRFELETATTSGGIPVINAVVDDLASASRPVVDRLPDMMDWLVDVLGPYPFDSIGAIVVDAQSVGYYLETQGRPTFTGVPDEASMIHELAHQWFGDSLTVASWPEIWLNEGFASYVEWLWEEHDGGRSAEQIFTDTYNRVPASHPFWSTPPGPSTLTDVADLFGDPVYIRGAMTLHALRRLIGDPLFFQILKEWTSSHRDANVTTAEFVALAEEIAKQPLADFFTAWLSTPTRPEL